MSKRTTFSEIVWLQRLLEELGIYINPVILLCDNKVALQLASNPIFHEVTKHAEIDCQFAITFERRYKKEWLRLNM